jgi:chromosome segregation protein
MVRAFSIPPQRPCPQDVLHRRPADAEAAAGDTTCVEAGLAEKAGRLAEEAAAASARLAVLQADAAVASRVLADAASAAASGRAAALAAEVWACGAVLAQAEAQHGAARAASAQAATSAAAAYEAGHRAQAGCTQLAAEAGALADVLAGADAGRWTPVLDGVQVPAGLEAALGAALGEALLAAADPGAPRHWRSLPPLPVPGPSVGTPLPDLVQAPPALARALSGIGLVADERDGDAAQSGLLPGQCLVSREGALWRWDGYTERADTLAPAATRLRQRNRLATLQAELSEAVAADAQARAAQRAAEARAGQVRLDQRPHRKPGAGPRGQGGAGAGEHLRAGHGWNGCGPARGRVTTMSSLERSAAGASGRRLSPDERDRDSSHGDEVAGSFRVKPVPMDL